MKAVFDKDYKEKMKQKNLIIKILSRDKLYDHSMLCQKLGVKNNRELIDLLFDYLITEINNININVPTSTYKHLEKVFSYLHFDYHSISESDFDNILNKLNVQ